MDVLALSRAGNHVTETSAGSPRGPGGQGVRLQASWRVLGQADDTREGKGCLGHSPCAAAIRPKRSAECALYWLPGNCRAPAFRAILPPAACALKALGMWGGRRSHLAVALGVGHADRPAGLLLNASF